MSKDPSLVKGHVMRNGKRLVGMYLSEELFEYIKAQAIENERTITGQVAYMLKRCKAENIGR